MTSSIASAEEDEGEGQQMPIHELDQLQQHGINAKDIEKLKDNGYHSVGSVMAQTTRMLRTVKGLSDIKVDKIMEAARKCQPNKLGIMSGKDLQERRKACFRVKTRSEAWDKILGGGFESCSVSEVFGEYRCGKTQLTHTMCVIAQLPKAVRGANGKVAVIDTEGTFRPERICQIVEARGHGADPDIIADNIMYVRAYNSEHQYIALCGMAESFATGEYRLLIVDSIMNLFRGDFHGRGELSERQQKLGQFLRKLVEFAEEFNLVVFMTNQVQSDPGASALFTAADGRKPTGGHVLAHASTTRVLLRKGRAEERVAKLMDSPDCPEAEATYVITSGGINDVGKE